MTSVRVSWYQRKQARDVALVACFLLPSLAIFFLYRILPLGWNVMLSFESWSPLKPRLLMEYLAAAGLDYCFERAGDFAPFSDDDFRTFSCNSSNSARIGRAARRSESSTSAPDRPTFRWPFCAGRTSGNSK